MYKKSYRYINKDIKHINKPVKYINKYVNYTNTYLNKTISGVTSDKTNLKSNLDFNFSLPDSFLGGGLTTANLSFNVGEIDLGNNKSDLDTDQSAAKTQGLYEKIGLNLTRLQNISERQTLYFSANGQYGFKNLDSGEQLSLGGVSGVKSFPNSEASGSHGIISTLEPVSYTHLTLPTKA